MPIKAMLTLNGPIAVAGDLKDFILMDANGVRYDLSGEKKIFLCRCGASVTKPFCDGHHSEIGFQAAEAAAKAQG